MMLCKTKKVGATASVNVCCCSTFVVDAVAAAVALQHSHVYQFDYHHVTQWFFV